MRRIEDLKVWAAARKLDGLVRAMLKTGAFRGESELVRQMKDASGSIAANLAEGYGRGSAGELRLFFNYSIGSATELQSHLYIALDARLCSEAAFREAYDLAELVKRLARTFLLELGRRANREPTFAG